jgi:hypothetical protein
MAKMNRERAVKERRARKQEKKDEKKQAAAREAEAAEGIVSTTAEDTVPTAAEGTVPTAVRRRVGPARRPSRNGRARGRITVPRLRDRFSSAGGRYLTVSRIQPRVTARAAQGPPSALSRARRTPGMPG